jgi:peroxiredoxin
VSRIALLFIAVVCLSAALMLVISAGLPEHARNISLLSGEVSIGPEIGAIAPFFELPTLNGGRLTLVQLRGNPVIVNFWATWCEPCQVELPILQTLFEQDSEQGLRVVAINVGETSIQDWVTTLHLTFDIALDEQEQTAALYQLRGIPSTYIIDPDGVITTIFYGPTTEHQLQMAIAPYLSLSYTAPD